MSEFWTAFGQALLILAALALFVVWVICAMVGVAGAIRRPEGSRYAQGGEMSTDYYLDPPMSANPKRGIEPRPHEFGPASGHLMAAAYADLAGEQWRCRAGLHPWVPENIVHEPARKGQPYGVWRCRSCRDERERRRIRSRGPQGGRASDDA